MRHTFLWFAAFAILSLVSGSAIAQTGSDNRLLQELLNRIDLLERELRQLRGELETLRYRQEQGGGGGNRYLELERRLQALERGAGIEDNAAVAPTPPITEPDIVTSPSNNWAKLDSAPEQPEPPPTARYSATVPGSEADMSGPGMEAYNTALDYLRQGQYDQAIIDFQDILRAFPGGELAGNAQYWLGEAFYITRDFDNAKEAFLALEENYPRSGKLPDALLRLGYIYTDQRNKKKASQVFQRLIKAYPDTRAASLAEKSLLSLR